MVQAQGDGLRRRVGNAQGPGAGILLPVAGAEQPDLIAVVLLEHQLAAQLRILGQIPFGPDVPAAGRAFLVVPRIGRALPVAQPEVAVHAEFQIVRPPFAAQAQSAMAARHILVQEGIAADHVAVGEMAVSQSEIDRGPIGLLQQVGPPHAELRKNQARPGIVHRKQHVQGPAMEAAQQVQPGGAELAQPAFGQALRFAGGLAACHGPGVGAGHLIGIGRQGPPFQIRRRIHAPGDRGARRGRFLRARPFQNRDGCGYGVGAGGGRLAVFTGQRRRASLEQQENRKRHAQRLSGWARDRSAPSKWLG